MVAPRGRDRGRRMIALMMAASFVLGYGYALYSHAYALFPYPQLRLLASQTRLALSGTVEDAAFAPSFFDSSRRVAADCMEAGPGRGAVILTLGQSNAANDGQGLYTPKHRVLNFNPHDGRCYTAMDPLLGTTGAKGGPWTRLADRLVETGTFDHVILVPAAVGSSMGRDWAPGGALHPRLGLLFDKLDRAGLTITHVLWHSKARLTTSRQQKPTAHNCPRCSPPSVPVPSRRSSWRNPASAIPNRRNRSGPRSVLFWMTGRGLSPVPTPT